MEKIREMLFGEYCDLKKAFSKPTKVKILKIYPQDTDDDLNIIGEKFLLLTNLKKLSIHTNPFHAPHLPEEIGQLIHLEKLNILNVPFRNFPNWLNNLTNLKALMIRGNDINTLPESLENLKNLISLRIENCELNQLPKCFYRLENLEFLSLSITKIKYISPDCLPPNLKILDIGFLQIEEENIAKIKSKRDNLKIIQS